ncbi:hypothetical protein TNCV_4442581 [Trichonephila clavipes]|nr:hypothetical protein TNCV_4442581 [Trichonephila clavipes]
MSEISSNLFPLKASFSRGNRKKSGGLRSGENGGCSICPNPFFCQELLDGIGCAGLDASLSCGDQYVSSGQPEESLDALDRSPQAAG